jgi:hypothetical protein
MGAFRLELRRDTSAETQVKKDDNGSADNIMRTQQIT